MPNQLINETSPYLLQHAENPVNWYPWGSKALNKAQEENKPIFLSIGYAACHWCHVMEHESFENPEIARLLNEYFVSIKVDREERPDLDGIYMNAVVTMTGQGGWPMSVFLTPQCEPFYGGTYFPPVRRHGMPAFSEVLHAIIKSWGSESAEMIRVGQDLAKHIRESSAWGARTSSTLRPAILQQATQALLNTYDWTYGGWGRAPRFPQPMSLEFLLTQSTRGNAQALQAAVHALDQMSRGGMYDVVGGGFHRYSTDDSWLTPHFEKMLYDNGQLAQVYLHAYLLTGKTSFRQVCTETLDFIAREMTHAEGGFFSSLDADSEGQEGIFYVWSAEEIERSLADEEDRQLFYRVYPVTRMGIFEGKNILQRTIPIEELAVQLDLDPGQLANRLSSIRDQMYAARSRRVRPLTDDKVLVSWNAMTLSAFAQAARYLKNAEYLQIARKNAAFLLRDMYQQGRLLRAWRDGQARHNGFLEDYACLIIALLDLYQSDPDLTWYASAVMLAEDMLENFSDPQNGFFDTRQDHGQSIAQPKEIQDNATPSGNALAAAALLRLASYSERADWRTAVEGTLGAIQDLLVRHPTAFAYWLQAVDLAVGPMQQIAMIGPQDAPETIAMLNHIWRTYRPRAVFAAAETQIDTGAPGLLYNRGMIMGKPTTYICEEFTCNLPITNAAELKQQIE